MSIKSTVDLTREQCIDSISIVYKTLIDDYMKKSLSKKSNQYLEGLLEELNDIISDGESYSNYSITDNTEYDNPKVPYTYKYPDIFRSDDIDKIKIKLIKD